MTEYIPIEKTKKGYYAAWEQGGRIHPDFGGGEAIVIVDESGLPVVPVFIRTHSDRKNGFLESGKHALIILKPHYFIIKIKVNHLIEIDAESNNWVNSTIEVLQVINNYNYAFVEQQGSFYAVCETIAYKGSGRPTWDEDFAYRHLYPSTQINLSSAIKIAVKKAYCFRCTHAHSVMDNPNKPKPTRWDMLDTDW